MGSSVQLGKLERVTIRDVWKDEAHDFTPWLALDANIALLSEAVGFQLEVQQAEFPVGEYRLDILARDSETGEAVVIENQFGETDHRHLGQLLTYAAGVGQDGTGANVIIWLAERFAEPHRSTLDWLNKISPRGISFFGIEIELWRIAQSPPAPKFNLVSKPNDWQKTISSKVTEMTEEGARKLQFWEGFRDFCYKEGTTLSLSSPGPSRYQGSSIGRGGFGINLSISRHMKRMTAELFIDHRAASQAFELLSDDQQLKNKLGSNTEFRKARKRAHIVRSETCDVSDPNNWPDMYAWLKRNGEELKSILQDPVKSLVLDEGSTEHESDE